MSSGIEDRRASSGFPNDTSPELETCRPSTPLVPRTKDQPSAGSQKVSSATPYTSQGAWTTAFDGASGQGAVWVAAPTRANPARHWFVDRRCGSPPSVTDIRAAPPVMAVSAIPPDSACGCVFVGLVPPT